MAVSSTAPDFTHLRGLYQPETPVERRLNDRLDGVALLAEALAHNRASDQFHELIRLFERAFRRSYRVLAQNLVKYLEQTNMGYTEKEILHWTKEMRDKLAHADVSNSVLFESDV